MIPEVGRDLWTCPKAAPAAHWDQPEHPALSTEALDSPRMPLWATCSTAWPPLQWKQDFGMLEWNFLCLGLFLLLLAMQAGAQWEKPASVFLILSPQVFIDIYRSLLYHLILRPKTPSLLILPSYVRCFGALIIQIFNSIFSPTCLNHPGISPEFQCAV